MGKKNLGAVFACASLFLGACVSVPQKSEDKPSAEAVAAAKEKLKVFNYTGLKASDKTLAVEFSRTLLPGDQDYYPRNAAWAEYVVEIKSFAPAVTIRELRIIGPSGAYVKSASSTVDLSKPPSMQGLALEETAVGGAAMGVSTALGAAGAFAGPALLLGHLIYQGKEMDDTTNWEREFEKRALSVSTLDQDSTITGSVFFPFIEKPRAFVIDYSIANGTAKQLRINLASNAIPATVTETLPPKAKDNTKAIAKPASAKKGTTPSTPVKAPSKATTGDI